jgi:hypothetical protein
MLDLGIAMDGNRRKVSPAEQIQALTHTNSTLQPPQLASNRKMTC